MKGEAPGRVEGGKYARGEFLDEIRCLRASGKSRCSTRRYRLWLVGHSCESHDAVLSIVGKSPTVARDEEVRPGCNYEGRGNWTCKRWEVRKRCCEGKAVHGRNGGRHDGGWGMVIISRCVVEGLHCHSIALSHPNIGLQVVVVRSFCDRQW